MRKREKRGGIYKGKRNIYKERDRRKNIYRRDGRGNIYKKKIK